MATGTAVNAPRVVSRPSSQDERRRSRTGRRRRRGAPRRRGRDRAAISSATGAASRNGQAPRFCSASSVPVHRQRGDVAGRGASDRARRAALASTSRSSPAKRDASPCAGSGCPRRSRGRVRKRPVRCDDAGRRDLDGECDARRRAAAAHADGRVDGDPRGERPRRERRADLERARPCASSVDAAVAAVPAQLGARRAARRRAGAARARASSGASSARRGASSVSGQAARPRRRCSPSTASVALPSVRSTTTSRSDARRGDAARAVPESAHAGEPAAGARSPDVGVDAPRGSQHAGRGDRRRRGCRRETRRSAPDRSCVAVASTAKARAPPSVDAAAARELAAAGARAEALDVEPAIRRSSAAKRRPMPPATVRSAISPRCAARRASRSATTQPESRVATSGA